MKCNIVAFQSVETTTTSDRYRLLDDAAVKTYCESAHLLAIILANPKLKIEIAKSLYRGANVFGLRERPTRQAIRRRLFHKRRPSRQMRISLMRRNVRGERDRSSRRVVIKAHMVRHEISRLIHENKFRWFFAYVNKFACVFGATRRRALGDGKEWFMMNGKCKFINQSVTSWAGGSFRS